MFFFDIGSCPSFSKETELKLKDFYVTETEGFGNGALAGEKDNWVKGDMNDDDEDEGEWAEEEENKGEEDDKDFAEENEDEVADDGDDEN